MQQLEERNTYTPTDIPHVSGNCDLSLNREETLSVAGLKTSSNNSDAALIATEHAKQNMSVSAVYVLNMRGQPLMPTTPRKAQNLLKEDKAKVVKRTPFTIQLKYATGEVKQEIALGIDSGYQNIGISAITEKKEVYSAEVKLRTDMVKLNSERRQYRRARRSRKTWCRPPRFLNRKNPEGWLAPSIQNKLDSHIKLINKVKQLLPITTVSRQIGGDAPDNLLTLCETCHDKVTKGKLKLDIQLPTGFKPETFMSIVRWKLVNMLRGAGNIVIHTYGYITKFDRIALGLEKSHSTDAFVIAGGTFQKRSSLSFLIQQVRKCNRKLFKGDRSHIKNTAPRFILGFQRFDKVLWNNIECFVFGRRKTGYFELRKLDGTKIHASAKAKELTLIETSKTLLISNLRRSTLPHTLKSVVSATLAPHGVL